MKVVIVGNGPAGITAAKTIRELNPDSEIVVYSKEPHSYYFRPKLPDLLGGSIESSEIYAYSEDWYRNRTIDVRLGTTVTEISPPKEHPPLVGIGGTITTLLAMKRGLKEFASSHIHHGLLKLRDIEEQIERLKILPLEKRRLIAGLPPERADIIMAGAMILFHSLARLGSERIWVSCQGLRHGILFDRFLP